ncbi:MAG: DHA2 family efflux MFS transporter permease subunit [Proteobacteria bacterium]|nr:DHA2 family efflux MFS transporter permease subunit [Pseudomonadota bacterium]
MSFNTRILPLVVASALFMEQMDSTIIATSLPDIAADLGTSPIALKLAFTTYLLGLTVVLPVSGWAADRYGAKNVFRIAIVIFTLGSAACGLANGLTWLVVARAVQGVGGALMVPVARIIVLRSVKKSELLDAIAWLTIPALIGPVIGPPVGGFITTTYDWRWIFWMNLPIGIIALGLTTWLMPNLKAESVAPLDVKGFFLVGAGLSCTILGMTVVGRGLLAGWEVVVMIAAGIVLLAAYVRHARRTQNPLLDLRMLREPVYRHSIVGGSIFRIAVGATPFLLPLMLQLGFGFNAFQSGLVTFASTLGALVMKFSVTSIVRRFGFRELLIINGFLSCAAIASKSLFTAQTPYLVMFGVLLLAGFLRSLQFSSLNALAYANIESADIAKANSLYTVIQQVSLAFGVAFAALLLDARLWWADRDHLVAGDFGFALLVVALLSALCVLPFLKLEKGAGSNISGKSIS